MESVAFEPVLTVVFHGRVPRDKAGVADAVLCLNDLAWVVDPCVVTSQSQLSKSIREVDAFREINRVTYSWYSLASRTSCTSILYLPVYNGRPMCSTTYQS